MSDVLAEICARKLIHVATHENVISLDEIKKRAAKAKLPAGFISAIKNHKGTAIIAEVKKASPSRGVIRENFDALEIAKAYESNGACCLSILTDEPYFQGRDEYLEAIKATVALPALRKDFMLTPYQIYESRALGADCVLLIMAALKDSQAKELYKIANDLGMDVLVEVHDRAEMDRALKLNPAMIGVNNRNLKTLAVDVQTSHELASSMPDSILKVAESGISTPATITELKKSGFQAFLIGESMMKQPDIGSALKLLLQNN